jgi:predicted metal-binding membrane protein
MGHTGGMSGMGGMGGPAFLGTWALSMAAMMLPSELPLLRLDYATCRSPLRTSVLAAGYVTVWAALAGPVLLVDWAAGGRVLGMHSRALTAAVLAAAALYQLTPLKRRCLAICRAPLARVFHGWRDGLVGAFRMGVENGLWCAGCCVGLMAALLLLGMMSVTWMVLVAAAIFAEKATRIGIGASRGVAVALGLGAVLWIS